jgi:hypothetical protein
MFELKKMKQSGVFEFKEYKGTYIYDTKYLHINFDDKFEKKNLGRNLDIAKQISNTWMPLKNSIDGYTIYNLGRRVFNDEVHHYDLSFEVIAISSIHENGSDFRFGNDVSIYFYSNAIYDFSHDDALEEEFHKSVISSNHERTRKKLSVIYKKRITELEFSYFVKYDKNEHGRYSPAWYIKVNGLKSIDEVLDMKNILTHTLNLFLHCDNSEINLIEFQSLNPDRFTPIINTIEFLHESTYKINNRLFGNIKIDDAIDIYPEVFRLISCQKLNLVMLKKVSEYLSLYDVMNTVSSFQDMFDSLIKKKKIVPISKKAKNDLREEIENILKKQVGNALYEEKFKTIIDNIPLIDLKDQVLFALNRYESVILKDGIFRFTTMAFSRYKFDKEEIAQRVKDGRHIIAHGIYKKSVEGFVYFDMLLLQVIYYLMLFEMIGVGESRSTYLVELIFNGVSHTNIKTDNRSIDKKN